MPKTILIADDDRTLVHVLRQAFEKEGCRVLEAFDGTQALRQVEEGCPDLIILDILMPKVHGYNFLFELRKIDGGQAIDVVVLTSNPDMRDIFMAEGVRDYIVKPCQPADLVARIRPYFNH
jgi:DNA-binding response OmpR family regulator